MTPAVYGIAARDAATGQLLRCDSVMDLLDLPPLLEHYATDFADRADVLVDLGTTPVQ